MRLLHKDYAIALALALYPVLLLTRRGGINGSFLLLAMVALLWLASRSARGLRGPWDGSTWAYAVAMTAMIPAIFMSEVVNHQLYPQPYDEASRFLAAIPVYLLLRRTRIGILSIIQYSFPLGAIASAVLALMHPIYYGARIGSAFLDPIRLGDLSLVLGFLSILSVDWRSHDGNGLRSLKWTGLMAGLYVSAVSGSRGGWLAIPPLLLIWLYYTGRGRARAPLGLGLALAVGAALASYGLVPEIHHRINDIARNFAALKAGDPNTSVGERLMLWKVAFRLFWQHPIFGIGPNGFQRAMMPLYHAGVLTKTVAYTGTTEVHSDIIARTVRYGVFGFAAILAIYLVPFVIFARQAHRAHSSFSRGAAVLGLGFVLAYFIFGLTIELFDLTMNAAFYSLNVAVLLAMATHQGVDDARPGSAGTGEGPVDPDARHQHVLAVLPSSLGDALLTTPALEALRQALPQARVDVLGNAGLQELLLAPGGPPINCFWVLPQGPWYRRVGSWLRLLEQCYARRYQFLVNITPAGLSNGSHAPVLVLLLGIPSAAACDPARFSSPVKRRLWRRAFKHIPVLPIPNRQHVVEENLRLVEALGLGAGERERPRLRVGLLPEQRERVARQLAATWPATPQPPRFVLIAPCARQSDRSWDVEVCAELVRALVAQDRKVVLTTGTAAREVDFAAKVAARVPGDGLLNLAGKTGLSELTALAMSARCVVAVDSGTMHVAAATQTPVVALFGPTDCWRIGPWGTRARCLADTSRRVAAIPVARIVAAVEALLLEQDAVALG